MKPPTGIERLTPAEAWEDGYRAGRESLALAYQHDKTVREQKEGRTLDRLDAIERTLTMVVNDSHDRARSIADCVRRVSELENGPKYLMTDEEARKVAESYASFCGGCEKDITINMVGAGEDER